MQCPGQDSRYWVGEDVFDAKCPQCGNIVEFFKDDSQRKCSQCGSRVLNPKMDFGCASYCPHADQCLGSMPPELLAKRDDLFKDRVTIAIRKFFGVAEADKFARAQKTAEYAEKIGRDEKGDMAVVVAGALLLGVNPLEKAREIFTDLKADSVVIERITDVLQHYHSPVIKEPSDYKIIHDADLIVAFEAKMRESVTDEQGKKVISSLLTDSGRKLAENILKKLNK